MTQKPAQLLKSLLAFLATTVGRDKICRFLQYGSRFLAAFIRQHIEKGTLPKEQFDILAGRVDRLAGNMSLTRKVLRFGRPIGMAVVVSDLLKQLKTSSSNRDDIKSTPLHIILKIISQFGVMGFFLLDHVSYFSRVDLMDKRPELVSKCEFWSFASWSCDCVSGVIANSMELNFLFQKLQNQQISTEENNGEQNKATQSRIDGCIVDLIRNIIDLPVAIGLMYPKIVSPGTVGLCGAITSFIGGYQAWK